MTSYAKRNRGPWRVAALAIPAAVLTAAIASPEGDRDRLPRATRDTWVEARTAHFLLFSNAGHERTRAVGHQLERLRDVLSRTSTNMEVNTPLPTYLYVFRSSASLAPYNRGPDGKPERLSGYFISSPDGNYVALDAGEGAGVIFHEYLHDFLAHNLPDLPLWLNEGLAELYSTFRYDATRRRAEIGRAVEHHLIRLADERLLPLGDLFAVEANSPEYNEERRRGTFYAQSWALAHYLLIGDTDRSRRMGRYFAGLGRGADPVVSLTRELETDLDSLQKVLAAYVRRSRFSYVFYRFEDDVGASGFESRELTRAETLYRLGDLLAHRIPDQLQDAELHLRAALATDAPGSGPYLALGRLRERQGRRADAAALYEAATVRDERNAAALERRAAMILERFLERDAPALRRTSTPPELLEARALYRRSLEADPDHAEALAGFGKTFFFDSEGLDEAIAALARANRLLPRREDILHDLIALHARSGHRAAARAMLAHLQRRATHAEIVRNAERLVFSADFDEAVALVNAGREDEARALLRAAPEVTADAELRRRFQARIASLFGGPVATGDPVDLYNAAVGAARAGDLERAGGLFRQTLEMTDDPDLRKAASEGLDRVRYNRDVERYNEAVELANAGQIRQALRVLDALLADEPHPQAAVQARALLEKLRR